MYKTKFKEGGWKKKKNKEGNAFSMGRERRTEAVATRKRRENTILKAETQVKKTSAMSGKREQPLPPEAPAVVVSMMVVVGAPGNATTIVPSIPRSFCRNN